MPPHMFLLRPNPFLITPRSEGNVLECSLICWLISLGCVCNFLCSYGLWSLSSQSGTGLKFEVIKRKGRFQIKMATEEDPELTSSHGHTKSIATYGTVSSEKNFKNQLRDSYTSGEREKTHIEVGRSDLRHSLIINPTLGTMTHNREVSWKPGAFCWGVKGLNPTSDIPTFNMCTWDMKPQNI